jgi:hypothetical protein
MSGTCASCCGCPLHLALVMTASRRESPIRFGLGTRSASQGAGRLPICRGVTACWSLLSESRVVVIRFMRGCYLAFVRLRCSQLRLGRCRRFRSLDYLDIIASVHMSLPAVYAGLVEVRIWLGRNAHNALRLKTQIFPENVMLARRILALHSPVSMLHIWRNYTVFGHVVVPQIHDELASLGPSTIRPRKRDCWLRMWARAEKRAQSCGFIERAR